MQPEILATTIGRIARKAPRKERGVFEKAPGSGIWWIRYTDADGHFRREKAGTKGDAIDLYRKRKVDALRAQKLPEKLRKRVVRFSELCDDAAKHTRAYNEGHVSEGYRIAKLKEEFGERPAESIPIAEFWKYFEEQNWVPGTYNRCRTVLYSIYRLGIENKKVSENPMKELKRRKVSDERERYLNQHPPLESKIDYLKSLHTEEERLRAVIMNDCPEHLDEFIIALNTGLRHKEQYLRIDWTCVDLIRKDLAVPPSKNGKPRHVNLNQEALAAFARLRTRQTGENVTPISLTGPIFIGKGGKRLGGSRHWWDDAVKKAAIRNFTWHDLRHTFASRLVMAGVDLSTVADLMGHINIQMTKRYAHLTSAHKQDAVDRLCTPIDTAQTGTSSR